MPVHSVADAGPTRPSVDRAARRGKGIEGSIHTPAGLAPVLPVLWSLFAAPGCAAEPSSSGLQSTLDDIIRNDATVPGVALVVRGPDLQFAGTAGRHSLDPNAPAFTLTDPFRVASVTKTFVSAALLSQAEDGHLSLDDSIADHLSAQSVDALRLGDYDVDQITVFQLIAHTAGIFDYTAADEFYETIEDDPSHRWSRHEQLTLAMDEGEPLNLPGAAYAYGDTHYILAGEILERSTGLDLARSLREVLGLDALGLDSTWLESLEDPPSEDSFDHLSHPYIGATDTRMWDPSWDLFGGGGLVSTAGDLVLFFDALFGGDVLGQEALTQLLTIPPQGEGAFYGIDGGLGINRFDVDGGGECWAAYGFFGTEVVHCPDLARTWAATLNQSESSEAETITNAILALE